MIIRKAATYVITLGSKSTLGVKGFAAAFSAIKWMNFYGEWQRLPEQDIAALRGVASRKERRGALTREEAKP
jgi:hypothetical protein